MSDTENEKARLLSFRPIISLSRTVHLPLSSPIVPDVGGLGLPPEGLMLGLPLPGFPDPGLPLPGLSSGFPVDGLSPFGLS